MRLFTTLFAAAALLVAVPAVASADTAPGTTITGAPAGTVTEHTVTFTFAATENGATFTCRLDHNGVAGAWQPCASPRTLQVDDGDYEFLVQATDVAGNTDPTPAVAHFTVDTSSVDTQIDAGPDGLTNDSTPTFDYSSDTPGATFECRIDGAGSSVPAFTPCTPPWTAPALASGTYSIAVRAIAPDGTVDPTPARRNFTLDADPPDTTIVAGPADGSTIGTPVSVFSFASSEGGPRFECRLDNQVQNGIDTAEWQPCDATTGFATPSLDSGLHTFEVRAIDAAGNVDPTPARSTFRVSVCEQEVHFGLAQARGACLLQVGTPDKPRWESDGDITLNGMPIPAPGSAKVVLEGPSAGHAGGQLSVSNITLTLAGVRLFSGALHWDLPDGQAGDEKEVTKIDLSGAGQKLLGLKVDGLVALRLGHRKSNDSYYAVAGLHLALPDIFKAGPSPGAGGVTGDVAFQIDDAGVHLDGLKVAVANAYVGSIGVKNVCLSFVAANATFVAPCDPPKIGGNGSQPFLQCNTNPTVDRWDGAAAIVLPTASHTELGLWAGLSGGALSYAGASVSHLGSLVPIAPGVFLDRVAVGVCINPPPFKIKGEAGVSFGPNFNGHPAALVDGYFAYTDAFQGQPWSIEAGGSLTLFDKQMAAAYVKYYATGAIDFGFNAGLDIGPAHIHGSVAGWTEPAPSNAFDVEGNVDVCVDNVACAKGNGVFSSTGAAGCVTVTVMSVPVLVPDADWVWWAPWRMHWESHPVTVTGGAGYAWATQHLDLMAGTCSIGQWTAQRTTQRSLRAVAAQAGALTTDVAPNTPVLTLRVHGDSAPPRVAFVGPNGTRIETPANGDGALVPGKYMLATNPLDNTTQVMIVAPAAGRWTIEAMEGSASIVGGLDRAEVAPAPTVVAGVGGKGRNRSLGYAWSPVPGERVTFVERGPDSQRTLGIAAGGPCPEHVPGKAGGRGVRCGRITFHPALGRSGTRKILALITQNGQPVKTVVVARYVAPKPARAGRPRALHVRRAANGKITVTWKAPVASAAPTAVYDVVVEGADGTRRLYVCKPTQLTLLLAPIPGTGATRVTVTALRADMAQGRPARAVLRPARKKHHTAPRHRRHR